MTGARGSAVTAASLGESKTGREEGGHTVGAGGARVGDFPPSPAFQVPPDHAGRCFLSGVGDHTAACSSGSRTGGNARVFVSEAQGLPIGHGGQIALTSTCALDGAV
jgi:hypothetical protein